MHLSLSESWKLILFNEFEQPYFKNLQNFIEVEYVQFKVFPPKNQIFNAFNLCPFNDVKVVILGQDPYHGNHQANGLSFSVNDSIKFPPSLRNIFKELNTDIGKEIPFSGNLEYLAKQGVLLLNSTLTVQEKKPGSHQNKGWEIFTDATIKLLSSEKESLVFILWGAFARKKGEIIDQKKHLVLESAHPSPFSAHRGFLGNQHFSKTNDYLREKGLKTIEW